MTVPHRRTAARAAAAPRALFAAATAALFALAALVWFAAAARAELPAGSAAADFTAEGAMAGEPYAFHLAAALEQGPVVMYFFPAAFTPGCNVEAALFAQAAEEFADLGATLVGLTAGNVERLAEFSDSHCAGAFPVAAVDGDVIAAYDVALAQRPELTRRTSYVIAPDATVIFAYTDMNPNEHVTRTLAALREWAESQGE
ncbi:MAG: peroxiredoxin [Maricaulaceae bacterium]|nr:peroxiredoxin [Maricaulaceae bacterium]